MAAQNLTILQLFEGASYLANIGLFGAALYGLKQLRISKNAALVVAKRDALKLANDQVKYYLETIIPMQNQLDKEIKQMDIKLVSHSTVEIENNKVKVELKPKTKDELVKVVGLENHLKTLNMMEAFASYFVSGAADENIAYIAIGKSYCYAAKRYMPFIALINSDEHYRNITSLFVIWQSRLQEATLNTEKESIERKLKEINSTDIIAIGTSEKDI